MAGEVNFKLPGLLNSNFNITTSGDVTGSGIQTLPITLNTVNSNVGTFQGITVNGKGLVTAASNQSYLTTNQTITLSGQASGSGTTAITVTLANPSSSTLGGVQSAAAQSHKWINTISTSGVPGLTQPAFSDLSGSATQLQVPQAISTDTYAYSFAGGV